MPTRKAKRGIGGVPPAKAKRHGLRGHRHATKHRHRPPAQGLEENLTLFVNADGREIPLPKEILNTLEGLELERSIELGSTLKLKLLDPNRLLLKAGYFNRDHEQRADFLFDDLWFRCANSEKAVDEFTLTAEDREIARMRDFVGPANSSAAQGHLNPRAVWVKKLLKLSGLDPHHQFFCPELGIKPPVEIPIEGTQGGTGTGHKSKQKRKGTGRGSLTLNGAKLTADQHRNLEILMNVCDDHKAPRIVRVAIVCAACGESTLGGDPECLRPNGSGYWGLLQGGSGQNGSAPNFTTPPGPTQYREQAESFLKGGRGYQAGGALALASHGVTDPGAIATKVEASGEDPNFYGKFKHDAEGMIDAMGTEGSSGESSGATEGSSYIPQREFKLPKNEKTEAQEEPEGAWENSESYAQEVNWRLFCVAGVVHFVSDIYLEHQQPWVEGIDESTPGVVDIKWQIDARKKVNPPTLELDVRAHLWQPPPGATIVMGKKTGHELHEGIWLVSNIHRPDCFDNAATVTLVRPKSPLAEKAEARKQRPTSSNNPNAPSGTSTRDGGHNSGPAAGPGAGNLPNAAFNCYSNAKYIAKQHLPYVWGGGHGGSFGPTHGNAKLTGSLAESSPISNLPRGLDCSGAVSWALGGGQEPLLNHPYDTTGLEFWGVPGVGKYFTVWVRSVPDGHTFIEFSGLVTGGAPQQFVAHKPGTIVEMKAGAEAHTSGNWKPRHWPNN